MPAAGRGGLTVEPGHVFHALEAERASGAQLRGPAAASVERDEREVHLPRGVAFGERKSGFKPEGDGDVEVIAVLRAEGPTVGHQGVGQLLAFVGAGFGVVAITHLEPCAARAITGVRGAGSGGMVGLNLLDGGPSLPDIGSFETVLPEDRARTLWTYPGRSGRRWARRWSVVVSPADEDPALGTTSSAARCAGLHRSSHPARKPPSVSPHRRCHAHA